MKDLLERLVELAKEWRDYALKVNGRYTAYYNKEKVWCYFAEIGNHSSVTFNITDEDIIEVSFHETPRINSFTIRSADKIENAILVYKEMLAKNHDLFDENAISMAGVRRQEKIISLENQIVELKQERQNNV